MKILNIVEFLGFDISCLFYKCNLYDTYIAKRIFFDTLILIGT